MSTELLPCPFCGGADIARANNTYGAHWTMCNACGAQTGEVGISSQDEADKRWNIRAHAAEQAAQEPSAECWRKALQEWFGEGVCMNEDADWIEQRARELQEAK